MVEGSNPFHQFQSNYGQFAFFAPGSGAPNMDMSGQNGNQIAQYPAQSPSNGREFLPSNQNSIYSQQISQQMGFQPPTNYNQLDSLEGAYNIPINSLSSQNAAQLEQHNSMPFVSTPSVSSQMLSNFGRYADQTSPIFGDLGNDDVDFSGHNNSIAAFNFSERIMGMRDNSVFSDYQTKLENHSSSGFASEQKYINDEPRDDVGIFKSVNLNPSFNGAENRIYNETATNSANYDLQNEFSMNGMYLKDPGRTMNSDADFSKTINSSNSIISDSFNGSIDNKQSFNDAKILDYKSLNSSIKSDQKKRPKSTQPEVFPIKKSKIQTADMPIQTILTPITPHENRANDVSGKSLLSNEKTNASQINDFILDNMINQIIKNDTDYETKIQTLVSKIVQAFKSGDLFKKIELMITSFENYSHLKYYALEKSISLVRSDVWKFAVEGKFLVKISIWIRSEMKTRNDYNISVLLDFFSVTKFPEALLEGIKVLKVIKRLSEAYPSPKIKQAASKILEECEKDKPKQTLKPQEIEKPTKSKTLPTLMKTEIFNTKTPVSKNIKKDIYIKTPMKAKEVVQEKTTEKPLKRVTLTELLKNKKTVQTPTQPTGTKNKESNFVPISKRENKGILKTDKTIKYPNKNVKFNDQIMVKIFESEDKEYTGETSQSSFNDFNMQEAAAFKKMSVNEDDDEIDENFESESGILKFTEPIGFEVTLLAWYEKSEFTENSVRRAGSVQINSTERSTENERIVDIEEFKEILPSPKEPLVNSLHAEEIGKLMVAFT